MKVCFLVALFVSVAFANQWAIVDSDYATIALSISFQTDTNGWVGGATASLQPLTLHTTNAGQTFNNSGIVGTNDGALLSIAVDPTGTYGIAGGLGFLGLPCGAYTTDGKNWNLTHAGNHEIICAGSDSVVTDNGQTMIIIGQWIEQGDPNGNGIQISFDAGKTFASRNWPLEPIFAAKYGWFANGNQGYVVGGSFPEDYDDATKKQNFGIRHRINRRFSIIGRKIVHDPLPPNSFGTGYSGVIGVTNNGGQNWTYPVFSTNGGYYFNQISCTDLNNCWAVAEGVDVNNGSTVSYIFHTSNAWQNYSTQFTTYISDLSAIQMINTTFGWAAGGGEVAASSSAFSHSTAREQMVGQFFLTTDGGQTWTLTQTIKNFFAFDLSVVDGNDAFAAGITPAGLCSLARYS